MLKGTTVFARQQELDVEVTNVFEKVEDSIDESKAVNVKVTAMTTRLEEIHAQNEAIRLLIENLQFDPGMGLDDPLLVLPGMEWLTVRVALLTTAAVSVGGAALDALTGILNLAGVGKPITNQDVLSAVKRGSKPQISRS